MIKKNQLNSSIDKSVLEKGAHGKSNDRSIDGP